MQRWKVAKTSSRTRLDLFVLKKLGKFNRSVVQKLAQSGYIKVEDEPEKPGYKLKEGQSVVLNYDLKKLEIVNDIEIPIIYEDDDCLVLNKPEGILTHSKGSFNPEATVASFIKPKVNGIEGERAGIVHRLDRATSGVIVCGKSPEATKWLQKQFSQRRVKKTYIAIVIGALDPKEAIVDIPIERNPKKPQTFRVNSSGKAAITSYRVIKQHKNYSLLELKPQTGRTHQLRVHLNHLGHPIVGDPLYGGEKAERMYLHALKLEVTLPSRERKVFEAPLPNNFKAIMR